MRTITESYNIYNYTELSQEAREKVGEWYLDDPMRTQQFDEIYTNDLEYLFPNSKLKIQFSLSYSQGDGLNIYGKLDLMDVFKAIRDRTYCGDQLSDFWDFLAEEEQRTIEEYMEKCGRYVELPRNTGRYSYCVADRTDFAAEWIEDLKYWEYKNINTEVIRKMETLVIEMFTKLSEDYKKYGYDFFYNADEEEIADMCDANGWEFLEDGTLYVAA